MKSRFIAAGAAAVIAITAGAWAGLGSADATTAQPGSQSWPAGAGSDSAAAAIASTKTAAAAAGSEVLLLTAHHVKGESIDINNDGFGAGDFSLFRESLRYANGGTHLIGWDSVRCTESISTVICDGTILVKGKGKITIYGAVFGPRDSQYAVTGGTGLYRGIGGQLLTANMGRGDTLLAFEITR